MGGILGRKSNLMKLIIMICTFINYGLFFGCYELMVPTEKMITIGIIAGFSIVYITLFIGVCIHARIDNNLNAVWAFYCACAHVAAACLLFLRFDFDSKKSTYGAIDGLFCIITSILCFIEWYLVIKAREYY